MLAGFAGSKALAGVPFEPGPRHLERARAVIAELGLAGLEDRPFRSLSTGQQRRCLLARAGVELGPAPGDHVAAARANLAAATFISATSASVP